MSYYDGTKLLSLKDIRGEDPEIYICTSNRTAGKTTYFNRLFVRRFLERGEKFALIYRYKWELPGAADQFFKDINALFFPGYSMTSKAVNKGLFYTLYLGKGDAAGDPCGYALAVNSADYYKKCSHLLSDIQRMLFDEFQPESGQYCPNEINKFRSLHASVARGRGEMVRRVPVYMLSNTVSLLNPYYLAWGITDRLQSDTKFLRGSGWVLEQGFNEAAAEAQKSSAFNAAFEGDTYSEYQAQAIYLDASAAFISRPSGRSQYFATLKHEGENFGLRLFPDLGLIYCDDRPDLSYHVRITTTTDDHNINYLLLKGNDYYIEMLKYYFEKGIFRFKNIRCKSAVLSALRYSP